MLGTIVPYVLVGSSQAFLIISIGHVVLIGGRCVVSHYAAQPRPPPMAVDTVITPIFDRLTLFDDRAQNQVQA